MTAEQAAERVLAERIRAGLRELADPDRAPQMRRYMKSALPYLGVRVPQVRAVVRAEARRSPPENLAALQAAVLALWTHATYREERYAATALLVTAPARRMSAPELIGLYERLIREGAWWDHVDEVAHRVGELLRDFPAAIRPRVAGWQRAPDRWLRRASIICQVGARSRTDLPLLGDAIEANSADPDFFVRKAIGWALRDYARTDPDWVRDFVATHRLSPLSAREALRHVSC